MECAASENRGEHSGDCSCTWVGRGSGAIEHEARPLTVSQSSRGDCSLGSTLARHQLLIVIDAVQHSVMVCAGLADQVIPVQHIQHQNPSLSLAKRMDAQA